MIEPSDQERSEWPNATRAYVEHLEAEYDALQRQLDYRRRLGELGIEATHYPGCGWNVFRWTKVDEPRRARRAYLLRDGAFSLVTVADQPRIAVFEDELSALLAAEAASKEHDPC